MLPAHTRDNTPDLEDIINISLVDVVAKTIRSNIYTGVYQPGQRLIVRELSESLGVSHTPIKDALNRLVSEGYVETLPRRSMVVRRYTNTDFIEGLQLRMLLEYCTAPDIIRAAQEQPCFLPALKQDLRHMKSSLSADGTLDYENWINCETQFHGRYMDFCKNNRMRSLYFSLDSNRRAHFTYLCNEQAPMTLKRFDNNNASHDRIVDAIERLDERDLARSLVFHILEVAAEYMVDDAANVMLESFRSYLRQFNMEDIANNLR